MDLASLVAGSDVTEVVGGPALSISSLVFRAQDATPGSLFFCVRGTRFDGHDFAAQAASAGAAAVVCERRLNVPIPQVVVPSVRRAMALMGARFYGDPSAELRVAAVTGTNGKTTTAHLMARIFDAAGLRSGLLGTVVNRIGGVDSSVKLTTAESLDLQRMFRQMADAGDQACAMEASSHALALHRTVGIHFAVVVFTNLTRDHLDFHSDLDDYFLAKRRLFLPDEERQPGAQAVINVEDEFGRRLAADCRPAYGDDDTWTFAVDGDADVVVRRLQLDADGSRFVLQAPRAGVELELSTQMGARFNVENSLAAATAMLAVGLPAQAVKLGLEGTPGVPGRFESVRAGQPFTVLVDFSHTPDSLDNALRAARAICRGRLLVVFGCGGDRDRGKRPIMGDIAARLADVAVVTSDNPRSEDPQAIIDDILAGIPEKAGGRVAVEADRRAAIGLALAEAQAGDVVVIAGKGHESGQIIGDRRVPFLDRDVANDWLRSHYGVVSSRGAGRGGAAGEPERRS
jgi:UDP-N-acetylmuramoyl-L-alanyl-D-glutamate--2,6-diaminopimelate ligase